jgi:hypothetical protein
MKETIQNMNLVLESSIDSVWSRTCAISNRILIWGLELELLVGLAAAQQSTPASEEAAKEMCQTGLGSAIAFAMGLVVVYLMIKTVFRAVAAFDKLGSTRSDEKYEGKQQLVGAAQTLAGAFMIPIFGTLVDQAGLPTLSCVDWSSIIFIAPVVV